MGILVLKTPRKGTTLGVWKIEEGEKWYFANPLLTPRVQKRIDSYKSIQRKLQGVAVRILIKELLPDEPNVDIDYDERSKPYFTEAPYKLSISHSAEMVAVLISDRGEAGVDIEWQSSKIERIANKFMNETEQLVHDSLEGAARIQYVHILWGAKESMFKLYGKGSLNFKKHLLVPKIDLNQEGAFSGTIEKEDKLIRIDGFYANVGKFVLVYVLEAE